MEFSDSIGCLDEIDVTNVLNKIHVVLQVQFDQVIIEGGRCLYLRFVLLTRLTILNELRNISFTNGIVVSAPNISDKILNSLFKSFVLVLKFCNMFLRSLEVIHVL